MLHTTYYCIKCCILCQDIWESCLDTFKVEITELNLEYAGFEWLSITNYYQWLLIFFELLYIKTLFLVDVFQPEHLIQVIQIY